MVGKVNVEVAPTQVRKLKEPFTVTTTSPDGFATLSLEELQQLGSDIMAAIVKYTTIMADKDLCNCGHHVKDHYLGACNECECGHD